MQFTKILTQIGTLWTIIFILLMFYRFITDSEAKKAIEVNQEDIDTTPVPIVKIKEKEKEEEKVVVKERKTEKEKKRSPLPVIYWDVG